MLRRTAMFFALPLLIAAGAWSFFAKSDPAEASKPTMSAADSQMRKLKRPVVVAEQRTIDLGLMNPGDRRRHRFTIENKGGADLTLELASTTCKCTLAEIRNAVIPPGGREEIELEWHAERPQFRFVQGATIRTNDPDIPLMELVGEGSVRVKLGTVPETVFLADVPRGAERRTTVLLYSQAFPEIKIDRIVASSANVSGQIADVGDNVAAPQESRFLRDLAITIEPQLKAGRFEERLDLHYTATTANDSKETGILSIPVTYDVVGDISIHGRDVIAGTLTLGRFRNEVGVAKRAYLHVRQVEGEVELKVAVVRPSGLLAVLGQPQQLTDSIKRYPLEVSIPAGTALLPSTFDPPGEIEIETTSGERSTIRLPVSYFPLP